MMRRFHPNKKYLLAVTWLCILTMFGFYIFQIAKIGIDLRFDFWDYWQNNRFYEDPNSALDNGKHVLREAAMLERADQRKLSDAEIQVQADQTAAGNPPPTIAQPGTGLFDSPWDAPTVWRRWQRLRPVYGHIFRGWVITYDRLISEQPDGDYQMDYPPLRSLVMTLWAWKVQAEFPSVFQFPRKREMVMNPFTHKLQAVTPDIIHPLLVCNGIAEAISAIAMFFLVWIWSRRENAPKKRKAQTPVLRCAEEPDSSNWRSRWGDPLLLIPPVALGLFTLLRPYTTFSMPEFDAGASLIDARIASVGWWIFLILRYTSVVALARFVPRPFRGLACAVVAGTMVWINPPSILDSFGWPQWEAWLIPFFLVAAVLVSLDWWLTAGVVLAFGGMFKGQLFFIAPVLVLCPLFAGWMGRFMRILTGLALGAGLVVWPWLITNPRAEAYLVAAVFAGALICGISIFRSHVWHQIRKLIAVIRNGARSKWKPQPAPISIPDIDSSPAIHWLVWIAIALAMITSAILPLLIYRGQDPSLHRYSIALTLAILLVPWVIPRRMIAAWITCVFASAIWLAGFSLNGSFAWWEVGFIYGTQKHQTMQLGVDSLSNLSSLLEQRYNWHLHDSVGTLHLPYFTTPIDLDIQTALAVLFAIALLICTVAAGIHLRRNDKKFLMALTGPSMLFVALMTQMAARYTIFPAVIAAALIGISFSTTLFQLLLVVLSCAMLGNQLLNREPSTAPIMYSITHPTHPDMGWLTLLLAVVFLVGAVTPSARVSRTKPVPEAKNESDVSMRPTETVL